MEIGIRKEYAVWFASRLVHQAEGTADQTHLIGTNQHTRLVADLPGGFFHCGRALFFGAGGALRMNVVHFHPNDRQVFQVGIFNLWRILGLARGHQQTALYGEVRAGRHCAEMTNRHIFQNHAPLYAGIRLSKEIRHTVDSAVPGAEDCRIKMERGWIDLVGEVNIADIGCLEVQVAQDEGLFRVLVNIGNAGVVYFQRVYLERADVLRACCQPRSLNETSLAVSLRSCRRLMLIFDRSIINSPTNLPTRIPRQWMLALTMGK